MIAGDPTSTRRKYIKMLSSVLRRGLGRYGRRASTNAFTGVWPIMATPFHPDESLDLEGFAKSIRFMKRAGATGCTIVRR